MFSEEPQRKAAGGAPRPDIGDGQAPEQGLQLPGAHHSRAARPLVVPMVQRRGLVQKLLARADISGIAIMLSG